MSEATELGDVVSVEREKLIVKLRPDIGTRPAVGEFVCIPLGEGGELVCVVSGMVNRIKEELLPYMDAEKVPKFLPYVEDYSENLVMATGLGVLSTDGAADHRLGTAVPLKAPVIKVTDEKVIAFHHKDGKYGAGYLFRLKEELTPQVALRILDRLDRVLPGEAAGNIKAARRFYEGGGFR